MELNDEQDNKEKTNHIPYKGTLHYYFRATNQRSLDEFVVRGNGVQKDNFHGLEPVQSKSKNKEDTTLSSADHMTDHINAE